MMSYEAAEIEQTELKTDHLYEVKSWGNHEQHAQKNLFKQSERWQLRREHIDNKGDSFSDKRMDLRKRNKKYIGKQKKGGQMYFPVKKLNLNIKGCITQSEKKSYRIIIYDIDPSKVTEF